MDPKTKAVVMAVGASFITNFVVKGIMKSIGLVYKGMVEEYGDSETDSNMTTVINCMHLCFNVFSLAVPFAVYKFGNVRTVMTGIIVTAISLGFAALPTMGLPYFQFVFLGIGCALAFHPGVILVNRLVDKSNGLANGLILSANCVGAASMFYLIDYVFNQHGYNVAMGILASLAGALLLACPLYVYPCEFVRNKETAEQQQQQEGAKQPFSWKSKFWDKDLASDGRYYLLCFSQSLNAIGFLNFTNFLPIHMEKFAGVSDGRMGDLFLVMQASDLLGRLVVPKISDHLGNANGRWAFYSLGCVGAGCCIAALSIVKDMGLIWGLFFLVGFFSSGFIGMWNSLIKATCGDKKFEIVYSHSLAVSGVMQMVASPIVVEYASDLGHSSYGAVIQMFGTVLASSAIPVLFMALACLCRPDDVVKELSLEYKFCAAADRRQNGRGNRKQEPGRRHLWRLLQEMRPAEEDEQLQQQQQPVPEPQQQQGGREDGGAHDEAVPEAASGTQVQAKAQDKNRNETVVVVVQLEQGQLVEGQKVGAAFKDKDVPGPVEEP